MAKEIRYDAVDAMNMVELQIYQGHMEQASSVFAQELRNLRKCLGEFEDRSDVTVWHCCTRDGEGYYTLESPTKKRFCRSLIELEQVGGAWGEVVWCKLFAAQSALNHYLSKLASELTVDGVSFEYKPLYISFLATPLRCDNERNERLQIVLSRQREYLAQYQIFLDLYRKASDPYLYYNHTISEIENAQGTLRDSEYEIVTSAIRNAINDIHVHRKALENCGQWGRADERCDLLYDLLYERGLFTYLRGADFEESEGDDNA